MDESHHFGQISQFLAGDWSPLPKLTVLPTFHAFAALTLKALGLSSLHAARVFSLLISLTTLVVFYACLRALNQPYPALRSMQFFFLPLLFPYCFLVHTDPPALLFLLLAFLAFHHQRYDLAALAACLSMLIRQTHVVWLAMFLVMLVWRQSSFASPTQNLLLTLRRGWLFFLGLAGFLFFWILNRGTALGDRPHHPEGFLGPPNIILFLLAACLLFFPLLLARQQTVLTLIRRHLPLTALLLLALTLLVLFFFQPTHPYNEPRIYVRNCLLHMAVNLWYRIVLLFPAALGLLCLLVMPLHERWMYALYPFLALFLAAHALVESRYLLPGLTLLLLSRPAFPAWLEQTLTVYWALLSTVLFVGMATKTFYP